MSKSLGNSLDPLDISEKFGADAARMALVVGNTPGTDMRISEEKVKGYKHFANKLWNIARFVEMQRSDKEQVTWDKEKITEVHKEYLKEFEALKTEITGHLENFEFHLAAEKLYHYVWHTLADKIIEAEKEALKNGTDEQKAESYAVLEHLLLESIKLLHPFMPFVTEEVFQTFRPGHMLMVEKW